MARQNVSSALAELINEGVLDEYSALELAELIFYENPKSLYRLDAQIPLQLDAQRECIQELGAGRDN